MSARRTFLKSVGTGSLTLAGPLGGLGWSREALCGEGHGIGARRSLAGQRGLKHSTIAVIRVIGLGRYGIDAVALMAKQGIHGVNFVAIDDEYSCDYGEAESAVLVSGADMLFMAIGVGNSGSMLAGANVGRAAKELGILTVAVVLPLASEGERRWMGPHRFDNLSRHVDSIVAIPSTRIATTRGSQAPGANAVKAVTDAAHRAIKGIAEIITLPGAIRPDIADIRSVLEESGPVRVGWGSATGAGRARIAAHRALVGARMHELGGRDAQGLLVNVGTDRRSLRREEIFEVMQTVKEFGVDASIIVTGTVHDERLEEEMRVTIAATGLG